MLTAKGWARRGTIVLMIVLSLALILAGCGAGDSPSAGGGLNPTRTVGKKATAKPDTEETEEPTEEETEEPTEEETEEPTEEETEEPTEEETEEPTEEETEEPTEEGNAGTSGECPLSQEEVEEIVGESVTDMKAEGTDEQPQCTYTMESFSVVSILIQDMGSENTARMGLEGAKGIYDNAEDLEGVGDGALYASMSGVPILQGYKGSLLVTLSYFSLSNSDADAMKDVAIELAKATFDKI